MTPKIQVFPLENNHKHCSEHGFHSAWDDQCNIMSGSCISTVAMEKTIGNKKGWAKNCFLELKSDHLEPKYITADPDSSAYRAATELYTDNVTKTVP